MVHAPARGHRGRRPGRPDRGVQPRHRSGGARRDGGTPRALLGGSRAGGAGLAQPELADTDTMLTALVSTLLPGFLERYAETLAPEHQEVCRLFAEHLPVWLRLRTGPCTATHGDFRLDNLLFQPGDPRPVVVDWQTLAWGGGSVDVAYFVGGCLSVEDRRTHESELLAQYHESLCAGGHRLRARTVATGLPTRHLRRHPDGHRRLHGRTAHRAGRSDVPHQCHPPRPARARPRRAGRGPRRPPDDRLWRCAPATRRARSWPGSCWNICGTAAPIRSTSSRRGPTPSTDSRWVCAPAPLWPASPSSPAPTSAGTAAGRCTRPTWSAPSSSSSWRPITCATSGACSSGPRRRRPRRSGDCARDLPSSPPTLGERIVALGLADAELTDSDDVLDPAGQEDDVYAACADELWELCQRLVTLL